MKSRNKEYLHPYRRQHPPTIAPGLEDDELHRDATQDEVESGDTTMVTRLSWDENGNGEEQGR